MTDAPWRLRGYTVERLLGSGASGDVWRARVAGTGVPVALKRVRVDDPSRAREVQSEAALLAALDHPHIVRLHALVPADGATVLVMDLADAGSLAELLAVRGRLTPGEAITAVAPVAAALAYLHDRSVVHGDVSPANILFTPGGVPLLGDVGVARLFGDDRVAVSTPAYVDPAVAAGCVPGPRSDVFMLAAVAFHALTGNPVWTGDADEALAAAALGRLRDVDRRLADAEVPEPMARVVRRGLEVDAHRRGTAADLALDLRHSGEPVAVELAAGRARVAPQAAGVVAEDDARVARDDARVARDAPVVARDASGVPHQPRHAAQRDSAGRTAAADPAFDRPAFDRPSSAPGGVGLAPPTRRVTPRPRPVAPYTPRRRHRRALALALVLAALALLATAGTVWASTGDGRQRPAAQSRAVPTPPTARSSDSASPPTRPAQPRTSPTASAGESIPSSLPTRSSAGSTGASSPSEPGTRSTGTPGSGPASDPHTHASDAVPWPDTSSQVEWTEVLAALDAVRAKAFASRDPNLLAHVYSVRVLRDADAELMRRIVPSGCALVGARTTYSQSQRSGPAMRPTITTVAVLSPSTLRCPGRSDVHVAGAGPARLRVELVRVGRSVRIGGQQRA